MDLVLNMRDRFFGNWEMESYLGSGSFGDVYKIKKEEFGVTYHSAMKIIRIPKDKNEKKRLYSSGMDSMSVSNYYSQLARNFISEIELMAKLQGNTNIVGYNDHIIEENDDGVGYTIYIRMEYLTPLDSYLLDGDKPRFMTQREVVKLGIDICNALERCAQMNIIHRDIKPENIFVSENGDFKLGDFGIARKLEATQSELSKKGTFNYMAPEVYKGENYNASVDIYSLGIVLYRLLNCNRIPFLPPYPNEIKYNDTEIAFAKRIKGEPVPYIPGVNNELNRIVAKACEFEHSRRYRTPSEFKNDLLGVYNSLSTNDSRQFAYDNYGETVAISNSYNNSANSYNNYANSYNNSADRYNSTVLIKKETSKPEPPKNNTDLKTKKLIIIIVAAIVALAVCTVAVFAIVNSSKKDDETTTEPTTTVTTQATTEETTTTTTTTKPTTKKATTKKKTTTKKQTTKKKATTKKRTTKKYYTTKRRTTKAESYDESW